MKNDKICLINQLHKMKEKENEVRQRQIKRSHDRGRIRNKIKYTIEGKDATEKEHEKVEPCQKACNSATARKRQSKISWVRGRLESVDVTHMKESL